MKQLLALAALLFSIHLTAQISEDGLLAYYPFDGNVLDAGPNGYDGNSFAPNYGTDDLGNPNASLIFNGSDEFVDISAFANVFRENLPLISIYFKVNFINTNDFQTLLSLGVQGENLGSNVFEIEFENNSFQIETELGSNAINTELAIDETAAVVNNEWHEILITLNGDSLNYYRDQELIYSGLYVPAETAVMNLFVGCYHGTGNNACCFFGGQMDELQFYNRILTLEDLTVSTSAPWFEKDLQLMPNPSSGKTFLTLPYSNDISSIQLFDVQGRLLTNYFPLGKSSTIEIDLPETSGIYFIQLIDRDGHQKIEKILRQ